MFPGRFGSPAARRPCPPLDVGPAPHPDVAQLGNGRGEVLVPAHPVVDDLGALHTETLGDLRASDQVLDVHLPAHSRDSRRPPLADGITDAGEGLDPEEALRALLAVDLDSEPVDEPEVPSKDEP